MGGLGSGNHGGGPCVEDSRKLNIDELIRAGTLRPGETHSGVWQWEDPYTGQVVDILGICSGPREANRPAHVELIHRARRGGGEIQSYHVRLVGLPQPFRGVRWYFICPLTARKCSTLFLPPGGRTFGSRQAYGLAYRSQRQSPKDRACQRLHKLRDREDIEDGKPLRMRWATWEKKRAKLLAAEQASCRFLVRDVDRLRLRSRVPT